MYFRKNYEHSIEAALHALRALFEFCRNALASRPEWCDELVVKKLERHALQLSALGHPVRLQILRRVVQGGEDGVSAGDIQTEVELPASTLSHHLKRLLDAELLRSRTEGTYHYYSADYAALRAMTAYVWEDCCKRGKSSCC